jgi:hypothetical protein
MVQKRKIIHYFYISAIFLISCMNKENKENDGNEINYQYKDTFINTPNSDSILNLIQKTSKINSDSDLNKFESISETRLLTTTLTVKFPLSHRIWRVIFKPACGQNPLSSKKLVHCMKWPEAKLFITRRRRCDSGGNKFLQNQSQAPLR